MNTQIADLTVILPNYNHAKYLPESLGALLRQTLKPKKIIIIDDASTDNSIAVIKAIIAENSNIDISLICNQTNQGVNAVCNQALTLVTTKYVFFPSADDICLENIFAESMSLLLKHPEAGFCSTFSYLIDETSKTIGECYAPLVKTVPGFIPPQECLDILRRKGGWVLGNTRIFKTECFRAMNGFAEELLSLSDAVLSMVIACEYGACFIPKLLAKYRYSAQAYSSRSSIDPAKIKQMLTAMHDILAMRHSNIFTLQDINVVGDRWLLTFMLSILRAGGEHALLNVLNIVPTNRKRLRKLLKVLQRLHLLRQPLIVAVILYSVVRPYDLYKRIIRRCYKPFFKLQLMRL